MVQEPSFDVSIHAGVELGDTLLVGLADIGTASLTATDYLVTHLETTLIGRIVTRNLPDIVPITDGKPRHPIRIYKIDNTEISILISELFIPVWVAEQFADALFESATSNEIDEITILYGDPFPHSEKEHLVFYVGTESFHNKRVASNSEIDIQPLPGGVLDGVNGELLVRGLDEQSPSIGALITPTHPPGRDFGAALRLLQGIEQIYSLDIDEQEMQSHSDEMERYFEELSARLNALQQNDRSLETRSFPEDRMYM